MAEKESTFGTLTVTDLGSFEDMLRKLDATRPARTPVPIKDGKLAPDGLDGVLRLAAWFVGSGLVPPTRDETKEQCIARAGIQIACGCAAGLDATQAVQNIMVVNNRPTIWGDAAIGLVWASGKCISIDETIEGDGDKMVATCRVQRRGIHPSDPLPSPVSRSFSVADAKLAQLWGKLSYNGKPSPWVTHPKRMLQMRARAFALRDAFADVLKGLSIREEVDDFEPPTSRAAKFDDRTRAASTSIIDAIPDQPHGAAVSQPTEPAAPAFDPAEIAEEMDKPKKRPVFDAAGNLVGEQ